MKVSEEKRHDKQNMNEKKDDLTKIPKIFTRRSRYLVFILMVSLNVLVNMDHGTIPAATNEIAEYLEIDKSTLGLFGSLAFFGSLLGSFISMILMNTDHRKLILLISLGINFSATFGLAIKNKYIGAFLRVVVGITQSFLAIYSPVWVDQFGSKNSKTIMMAIQQVSSPLGIVFGYIVTFLIKKKHMWYWAVIIQAIAISILVFVLLFIDSKYFSSDYFAIKKIDTIKEGIQDNRIIEVKVKSNKSIKMNKDEKITRGNNNGMKRFSINKIYRENINVYSSGNLNNYNDLNCSNHLNNHNKICYQPMFHESQISRFKSSNFEMSNTNFNMAPIENINDPSLASSHSISQKKKKFPIENNKKFDIGDKNLEKCLNGNSNVQLERIKNLKNTEILNSLHLNEGTHWPKSNFSDLIKNNKQEKEISLFCKTENIENYAIKEKIKEFFLNIKKLLKEKVYVFAVLAVSILNFISVAIQYWVSDHLKKVMKFNEDEIFISFVITCVTAPALGVVGGGFIVQKNGGYESKKSVIFCLIFSLIAAGDSIAIIFQEKIVGFSIVLWVFLFFGGAIIPNLIGIFISSLPNELRGFGNSFSTTVITLIGQLPAPYIYGSIYNVDPTKKTAFNFTLLYSWAGVVFIAITAIIRVKSFNNNMNISENPVVKEEFKENKSDLLNLIYSIKKSDENIIYKLNDNKNCEKDLNTNKENSLKKTIKSFKKLNKDNNDLGTSQIHENINEVNGDFSGKLKFSLQAKDCDSNKIHNEFNNDLNNPVRNKKRNILNKKNNGFISSKTMKNKINEFYNKENSIENIDIKRKCNKINREFDFKNVIKNFEQEY